MRAAVVGALLLIGCEFNCPPPSDQGRNVIVDADVPDGACAGPRWEDTQRVCPPAEEHQTLSACMAGPTVGTGSHQVWCLYAESVVCP